MKPQTWLKIGALLPLFAGALFSSPARASTRTVYFDQSAVASSVVGFTTAQNARCRIAVSNPSDETQEVTIHIYPTSVLGNGSAAIANKTNPLGGSAPTSANPSSSFTGGSGPTDPYTMTISNLAKGQSAVFDFAFQDFPASMAATDQQLNCRGDIVASDSGASPGFVVANGMILTFSESSAIQTQGATSASTAYGGSAVYTQLPISINGGKPF